MWLAETVAPARSTALWAMRHDQNELTAEIMPAGERWEFRIFAQGELITWRRFEDPADAMAYADLFQRDLARDGWRFRTVRGRGFGSR